MYLSLHIILEFFSIAVSFSIMLQGWLTYPHTFDSRRLYLGAVFLAVGTLDLVHTLSFQGMPPFITESSVAKATWFWVTARLTEAISLAIIFFYRERQVYHKHWKSYFIASFFYAVTISCIIIGWAGQLPVLVVEGQGVTNLKLGIEYLVSILHLATVIMILRRYREAKQQNQLLMITALVFLFCGELIFTLYRNVHSVYNMLGHVYKVMGYFYLLRCMYIVTVDEPFVKVKQVVKKMRDVEEELKNFFNIAQDLYCIFDAKGQIRQINQSFITNLGYTKEDLLNQDLYTLIHPEDRPMAREEINRSMSTDESAIKFESRNKCHDGSYKWLAWVAVFDQNKELFFAAARDVTDQKEMLQRLHAYQEKLEDLVEERTIKLSRANKELDATNKELESFSYSVSHDLRTPLRSMDGFSLSLLEDYEDQLDDVAKDYLYRIRAASQRMGQMIDDLLHLSRVTRQQMLFKEIDLSQLAREVFAELQATEPERQVEFKVSSDLIAQGDVRLLKIALSNLIGNALKFSAKVNNPFIEIGRQWREKNPVYFVRDNGVGFDMAYVNKLFRPFERLHGIKEFSGTGIGLATVKRVIDRHGGKVWAEGRLGQGATIYFTLQIFSQTYDESPKSIDIYP
ncbi:MASE3 domain-containing protein [Desulfotomaculum sp. 1211_IL3151]|uniref:MASE3 domain-containing protein n=1 Tax=Desulfotomaculum sp. 1211_IL3151 TaxID=3084055 RepID=UPI002FDA1EA9